MTCFLFLISWTVGLHARSLVNSEWVYTDNGYSDTISDIVSDELEPDVDLDICRNNTDGCSVPLHLNFPYKHMFNGACQQHDICYECVSFSLHPS